MGRARPCKVCERPFKGKAKCHERICAECCDHCNISKHGGECEYADPPRDSDEGRKASHKTKEEKT